MLSGGPGGDVGYALLAGNAELAKSRLSEWKSVFPDRYYMELQRTGRKGDDEYLHAAVELAESNNIPVVATNDTRFINKDDFEAHEARVCINSGYELFAEKRKPYDERLQTELDVINGMGFPGYFLIVADFIQWSKDNDIPVGPGRGSGAGSLVAYALKITDIDPLLYDLLFERFLNPERVSMPDFDIDFCMDKRELVIDYVAETYGREKVSQIITYGSMAAKAVVRDCGRILNHPYGFVDRIAKLIPFEMKMTLTKAMDQEPDLKELYEVDDEVKPCVKNKVKMR